MLKHVDAGVLNVAYLESGPADGTAVILCHGFPYDVQSYVDVTPRLVQAGYRVLVPYLRGYGPTRFLSDGTLRSGEQAVLGNDLLEFMNALAVPRAVLGGYDWGGRAACIVSALWPERVIGLVTVNGYNIQNIARSGEPAAPAAEHRYWYQYYLHGERGHAGLKKNRYEFCKLLWNLWSPNWRFDDAVYAASASSFENPDFVDVVVHSYRHRYALVAGDDSVEHIERALAAQPSITVPTIALDGEGDGVQPAGISKAGADRFTGGYEVRHIPTVGHNLPQEAPEVFAQSVMAITDVMDIVGVNSVASRRT